ncbi:15006_t:CDS:2, partial [Gigaspora margarita]
MPKLKLNLGQKKQLNNEAHHYYHPAKVSLASVARTNMKQHVNEHYCLASVKVARVFAVVFASNTVIISQDDKAKIGLDISVVGCTFKTMQSINELVTVEDYDFLKGSKIKLIPSVYLLIDSNDSNTTLCSEQLTIFIWPEYF